MAGPWIGTFSPEPNRRKAFVPVPRLMRMPPRDAAPLSYFKLLFPDILTKQIIRHTNTYAKSQFRDENLRPRSRTREWKKIGIPDFNNLLAIIFNMSIIKRPSMEEYWNTTMVSQRSNWFQHTMDRSRFQNILKFLHINDCRHVAERNHSGYNPSVRFRPLLHFVNRQFMRFKVPNRELCVDESLVPTKGHNVLRQYIPSKVAKYGVKFWVLCEFSTGYVLQMQVYRGREFDPVPTGQLQGTNVVIELLQGSALLSKGYHVFCDSFFASLNLGHRLLQLNTDFSNSTHT